jgi:tripartite-type tricarboxylate transporter receptor subunit TctC
MRGRRAIRYAKFAVTAAAILSLVTSTANAQGDYPNRPIRLVAPSPPAGVHDVIARLWADRIKSLLGPIVIENKPGAGTLIGATEVVKAEPDGYTILLGSTSSHIIVPVIAAHSSFDPLKDLATIAIISASATSIVVNPAVPARSLQELIGHAKANPGKLSYGSAGVGSMSQMTGELFKKLAGGLDIVHVPYKGAGPSITDVISGHIPIATPNATGQVLDLHKSGKLRVLAVNAPTRLKAAPEIPTAVEQGLPDMTVLFFCGLFAPANTPKPIIDRIHQATLTLLRDEDFRTKLMALGYEAVLDKGPGEAEKFIRAEQNRWTPIVRASGAKLD